MKSLRVIFHYSKEDPRFRGDCLEVSIITDGKQIYPEVVHREDYPHGAAQCFIEGVKLAAPFCSITEESVADVEC